ncbi:MAG: DNA-binding protein, partial [Pseudonocardia sp.]|nr:DNA-binding protein [Pseudonocardia sp.]
LAMAVVYAGMVAVRNYYRRYDAEVAAPAAEAAGGLHGPAHVHAVVLVRRLNRPVLRAIALATATRPDSVEAVAAGEDDDRTGQLRAAWAEYAVDVPLRVLDAPYRDIGPPLVVHISQLRDALPGSVVIVFVPEVVVAHGWENLLHNQSALRLKARLLRLPGVVVVDVPYRLGSREIGWLAGEPEERAGRRRAGPGQ